MLVAIIYLYSQSGSFSVLEFHKTPLGMTPQILIFLAFLAAFSVKVPMVPVHTWLPDAHVEAPTGGSVILAAVLLKMGAYGLLRFSIPIAPDAARELAGLMIALSLVVIVYIAFVALVQRGDETIVPRGSTVLDHGDALILIGEPGSIQSVRILLELTPPTDSESLEDD